MVTAKDVRDEFELYTKLYFKLANAIIRKQKRFVMISVPPRHTKSMTFSEVLPSYYLGKFPDKKIIHISYDQELVEDFGVKIRETINSPDYGALFPGVTVAGKGTSGKNFRIANHLGTYKARSVGSGITGHGGDLIIVDDILKDSKEAMSPKKRKEMKQLWVSTMNSRLQPGGQIVIVSTRWHEDDLIGWLRRTEPPQKWDYINIPALCIDPKNDPIGRTEVDEAIWEEWKSRQELMDIRNSDKQQFYCVYQGTPIIPEGSIFEGFEKFEYRLPKEAEEENLPTVMLSYDTATGSEEGDYTVCTHWALSSDKQRLLMNRKDRVQVDFKGLIDLAKKNEKKYRPAVTLIEKKSSGIQLYQYLQGEKDWESLIIPLKPKNTPESKILRAKTLKPLIQDGTVCLLDEPDTKKELQEFPVGVNDDIVDSIGYAATWYFNNRPELLEIYKEWLKRLGLRGIGAKNMLVSKKKTRRQSKRRGMQTGWR